MQRSNLSIKSLEIFRQTAQHGHVQTVAQQMGLSIGTVSHHLKRLEQTLGVMLLDHARRPMALTAEGSAFLEYATTALDLLQKAEAEALSGQLSDVRNLRLALIEDFEAQIAPELAVTLAQLMPSCAFTHLTRPSHEIQSLLLNRSIDVGIATQPHFGREELTALPLLRDPFVLALPKDCGLDPLRVLKGDTDLHFLRYSDAQIIGAQISSHLQRLRIELPRRFQFESNPSLMGMVAEGAGWAITTPTNFIRATRFADSIDLVPFPGKKFAREICVFTQPDFTPQTARLIWAHMRDLIDAHMIAPAHAALPWLGEDLILRDLPPEV